MERELEPDPRTPFDRLDPSVVDVKQHDKQDVEHDDDEKKGCRGERDVAVVLPHAGAATARREGGGGPPIELIDLRLGPMPQPPEGGQ